MFLAPRTAGARRPPTGASLRSQPCHADYSETPVARPNTRTVLRVTADVATGEEGGQRQ